jgi:uncharacterized protein YhdP
VRAGFVQHGRHRFSSVAGTVDLADDRIEVQVQQARLCGLHVQSKSTLERDLISTSAQFTARGQQVSESVPCLTEQRVALSGAFDLDASLHAVGDLTAPIRTLTGSVQFNARNGRIFKLGLLGNILAMKSVTGLLRRGLAPLDTAGFDYRKLKVEGRLQAPQFAVETLALDSDALGVAGGGTIDIDTREANLTLLVAPFSNLDRLVRAAPIVGYVVGGSLTSVPLKVSGDIRDPNLIPLAPQALSEELAGLFTRALNLPARLLTVPAGQR